MRVTERISLYAANMALLACLAGCLPSSNPLKTTAPKKAAKFLVTASQFAEKKLNIFNAPGGYYYGVCMDGKEKQTLCKKLYQAMSDYANTIVDFKGVSVINLTDKLLFEKLKDDYKYEQFNAL